jgi:heme exporter protein D
MHDFLMMGGYAAYVWPAYGLAAAILIGNVIAPWQRERRLRARIRETIRRTRVSLE